MEDKNYTVYIHIHKDSGKTYIGITRQEPERRWGNGVNYKNIYFGNAIKKYGWDNFEHIILFENKTKEEAENLEVLFIKILLSNNRTYGYNISNGGSATGKVSDETREKISNNKKGNTNMKGKKHSLKSRQKMSIKLKGMFTRGDNHHAKKVICDGKIFDCIVDCAEYYEVNYSTMHNWLYGSNKMPKKFVDLGLKYLGDVRVAEIQTHQHSKMVLCDGLIFNSISKCAKYYNIKNATLSLWLNGKSAMPQGYIDKGLRFLDDENFIPKSQAKNRKVVCDNAIYNSIKDCAIFYNENPTYMRGWLSGNRKMPQKFINLGLKYYDAKKDLGVTITINECQEYSEVK